MTDTVDQAEGYSGIADPQREWKVRSHYWRQSPEFVALRTAIKALLISPFTVPWTIQGFGMMRTYLPYAPNAKRFRLNVWDARLAVPEVSMMHDHPWDFTSWVINGKFQNVRFVEDHFNGDEYKYMTIMCGECGGAKSEALSIRLRALPAESYGAGSIYHQDASEVHVSGYDDGTVTLNDRVGDTEHARVFWPAGLEWVDAKPRPAGPWAIHSATKAALAKWED